MAFFDYNGRTIEALQYQKFVHNEELAVEFVDSVQNWDKCYEMLLADGETLSEKTKKQVLETIIIHKFESGHIHNLFYSLIFENVENPSRIIETLNSSFSKPSKVLVLKTFEPGESVIFINMMDADYSVEHLYDTYAKEILIVHYKRKGDFLPCIKMYQWYFFLDSWAISKKKPQPGYNITSDIIVEEVADINDLRPYLEVVEHEVKQQEAWKSWYEQKKKEQEIAFLKQSETLFMSTCLKCGKPKIPQV